MRYDLLEETEDDAETEFLLEFAASRLKYQHPSHLPAMCRGPDESSLTRPSRALDHK
jgi:hypothetical protein